MRRYKKKLLYAFSLIELMLVIGISGILAAVSLSSMQKYKIKAKTAEATAIIATIRTTNIIFYNENGYFGGGGSVDTALFSDEWSRGETVHFYTEKYISGMGSAPVAEGTRTNFVFLTNAAEYDESGTMVTLKPDGSAKEANDIIPVAQPLLAGSQGACYYIFQGESAVTAAQIGGVSSPSDTYHYFLTYAMANLNNHNSWVNTLFTGNCTFIMQFNHVHPSATGNAIFSTPMINFNVDYSD